MRRRKKEIIPLSDPEELKNSGHNQAEIIAGDRAEEQAAAIEKHMQNLAEEDSLLLRLFYFAKKSLKEIAEQLSITANNARQKLHRARERLRRLIMNDPEFKHLFA